MNRKKLLLFILAILLVLSLVYSFFRMPREQRVANLKFRPGQTTGAAKAAQPAPLDDKKLHFNLLEEQKPRFSGFRKNIFRPIFHEELKVQKRLPPPPPPPSGAQKKSPALPAVAQEAPGTGQGPPPPQTPEAVREMAKFTFLGFVKSDNRKTIFLSKDNRIFLVRKGSRIEDRYEVSNITDDALTIVAIADQREMIIPLEENKPLTPMKK